MNKKIIIIAGIVIVIAIIGAAFFLTKGNGSVADTPAGQSDIQQTADEDLGLCDIVDVATIKSALGSVGDTLAGPNNTGVTSLGDGDKGQTCVYPLAGGDVKSNSFYTDLAQYSQKSYDAVADFTATDGTSISGVGDRATFKSSETLLGAKEFTITAVKGTNVYLFVISQPADAVTFDDASAQTTLTTIAQAASLK